MDLVYFSFFGWVSYTIIIKSTQVKQVKVKNETKQTRSMAKTKATTLFNTLLEFFVTESIIIVKNTVRLIQCVCRSAISFSSSVASYELKNKNLLKDCRSAVAASCSVAVYYHQNIM